MIVFNKMLVETFSTTNYNDLTDDAQMIRAAIMGELDAINLYEQLAIKIKNPKAKKVLLDIAYEEKVHIGELEALLKELDPDEDKSKDEGESEVKDS